VGSREYVQVDTRTFPVRAHDRFLVCSDGLHGYLDQAEVARMRDGAVKTTVERAVALANQRGGRDNITAVVVELS
jgi:protein phosphatase